MSHSVQKMQSNNGGYPSAARNLSCTKVKIVLRDSAFVIQKDKRISLLDQGIEFCKKVRGRLNGSSQDYEKKFLKYIHACSSGKIGKTDLTCKISQSISKYPDLVSGFEDFVKHCENIAFPDQSESTKKVQSQTVLDTKQIHIKERFTLENSNTNQSIQELDLSKCLKGTPSYRLHPEDYPVVMSSQRSALASDVLNDYWVCTPVGNNNYSPKIPGRSKYEKALDKCEDDQYEFDMLLNSTRSAAERVEELVDRIKEKKVNMEAPFRIEDHLSVLNLRLIERLYDAQGSQMLEMLKEKPSLVLDIILSRLKQKIEELTECGSGLNKVWAQVYAENHQKSLEK